MKITCNRCGHVWSYKGKNLLFRCPSCDARIRDPRSDTVIPNRAPRAAREPPVEPIKPIELLKPIEPIKPPCEAPSPSPSSYMESLRLQRLKLIESMKKG